VLYVINSKPQETGRDQLLKQLISEHDSALRRFVRVRVGSSADCDDLVQEVYARLAQIEGLEVRLEQRLDTARNYLFQIAANLITDKFRKAKVRKESDHISDEAIAMHSTLSSPDRQLEGKRKLQLIQKALGTVKPEYQQAFLLSRMDNMSYREISDTMGVSVSTVEKYISAALVTLRDRIKGS